ncbi:Rv3654c family TadE-like protein [Aestuariimicrobium soli]|uniref:Rv3654c family TadE-like protein n=1 Tax=Aestuariimicrobium soli TaxID=2035834 RepID=UPI003EC03B5E
MNRGQSGERGVGTVLTAVVMMAIVAATVFGLWGLGWLRGHAIAADAADSGALAAARAYAADPEADSWAACQRGAAAVVRNGATAVNCVFEGDETSFVVTVTAEVKLWPRISLPGAPRRVQVTALAGSGNAG